MKVNMKKINELSNFKCNHVSHIKKIRDTAIALGSRDSFQDLESQLANSYHIQNASEWF